MSHCRHRPWTVRLACLLVLCSVPAVIQAAVHKTAGVNSGPAVGDRQSTPPPHKVARLGGPEDLGCATSYDVSTPSITWYDASDGIEVAYRDDQNSGFLKIPFRFQYYGYEYEWVAISSNGWISFEDMWTDDGFYEQARGIPSAVAGPRPEAPIAVAWADLDVSADPAVFPTPHPVRTKTFGSSW